MVYSWLARENVDKTVEIFKQTQLATNIDLPVCLCSYTTLMKSMFVCMLMWFC